MAKNNAKIIDISTIIQAGVDPKTGLPAKLGSIDCTLKNDIRRSLRVLDEQNAVNRYVWYNFPGDLSSQEIERLLYYKGQLAFFYMKELDAFYIMPYALSGSIDFYGRFRRIHPVPFANGTSESEKADYARQRDVLSTKVLDVLYDIPLDEVDPNAVCVLLHDYTKQLSQTIVPRQEVQEPILDVMSDIIPFARTAALNATGVRGMRVTSADEASNVEAASRSVNSAALTGRKYIAIEGQVEFQDLTDGTTAKSEEFMMLLQSLDNYRLSLYGLKAGGLFQKQSHMLQAEADVNDGNTGLIMTDGLAIRQRFCDICNAIWGLGMSVEVNEVIVGVDTNGDGILDNDKDQSGTMPGDQPTIGGMDNVE